MAKIKATKPTLAQKKLMTAAGLIASNWLVLWENSEELRLVSRMSGVNRHIKKSPSRASKRG